MSEWLETKIEKLTSTLRDQMKQSQVLDKEIKEQLAKIGINL